MKKILSITICIIMIAISFAGCSSPNAEMTEENITKTVETVETALKEFDTDKLGKYVDSPTLTTIITYSKGHEQFTKLGQAIFENLTIEITNIDIENSTVTISVSNKDLSYTANNFAKELKEQFSSFQLLANLNNDDFLDSKLQWLCNEIERAEMLPNAYEITLSIEQRDKNLVLSFDDGAEDAVSGGALTGIKKIYK